MSRFEMGGNIVCVGCIALMLLGNLMVSQVAFQRSRLKTVLPSTLVAGMERLRLDQSWSMFSPDPPVEDGWLVFEATLADGSKVDLLRGEGAVSLEKPASVSGSFGGDRWKAYFLNLIQRRLSWRRAVEVYVDDWNDRKAAARSIKAVSVVFVAEDTDLSQETPTENVVLYRWEPALESVAPGGGE